MKEMELLNKVRLEAQKKGCTLFRINVATGRTQDGRFLSTGAPKGYSDLSGLRNDGRAVYIETKIHPRKPTKEQCLFLLAMIKKNACAGVAFDVDEALDIIEWNVNTALQNEMYLRSVLGEYK